MSDDSRMTRQAEELLKTYESRIATLTAEKGYFNRFNLAQEAQAGLAADPTKYSVQNPLSDILNISHAHEAVDPSWNSFKGALTRYKTDYLLSKDLELSASVAADEYKLALQSANLNEGQVKSRLDTFVKRRQAIFDLECVQFSQSLKQSYETVQSMYDQIHFDGLRKPKVEKTFGLLHLDHRPAKGDFSTLLTEYLPATRNVNGEKGSAGKDSISVCPEEQRRRDNLMSKQLGAIAELLQVLASAFQTENPGKLSSVSTREILEHRLRNTRARLPFLRPPSAGTD
uniref:Uncharacterized protein n=1 Tax=Kwoniella dejecticola CBS 10117 TaxID=1296121 RepID=A0A1A6A6N7_9TREE|nr:uncharacterized protein I303_03432 [Kwoniella dejecticola CBS 10117]OBR85721.1 hypothetical protein I303_03432 [Kwoniella dejecticola CBS 10117]